MNRLIKTSLIMIVVSLLVLPVSGEMGRAGEMMKKGVNMRSSAGMTGMGFMYSAGGNFGNYVTFTADNSTGAVTDYGISGITIFNSIKIAGFNFKEVRTTGALTTILSKDGSQVLELHDNPASVIKIKTKGTTNITFVLAEGVNASRENNSIRLVVNNMTSFITATNATMDIAAGEIRIVSGKGNTFFRSVPVNMPMDGMPKMLMEKMRNNRAGAEISAGVQDRISIINYSEDMFVRIDLMRGDRMRMMINSADPEGKILMMNFDNSSLTWNDKQKIHVYLDGKPLRQVMMADKLYAANRSCFWLTTPNLNKMQGMIYISNFSERTVDMVVEESQMVMAPMTNKTVTSPSATGPDKGPAATPGPGIVIGLFGACAAYIMRKWR